MLVNVVLVVANGDILDFAVSIVNWFVDGVYKALVGCDIKVLVALENLGVNLGINLHSVGLYQLAACLKVTLALDALHLGKQLAKEGTQLLVVVNLDVGLATSLLVFHNLNNLVFLAHLVAPLANELAVAHVRLLNVLARLDAGELGEKTVHDVLVVLGLLGVRIFEDAKLHEFGIGKIIQSEEVGATFFEGCAIGLESIGVNTWEQLSAGMT